MSIIVILNLLRGKFSADFYRKHKKQLDEIAFLINVEQQEMEGKTI